MSHLLLLTKSTQSSVEVLPALALLPHHVKILPAEASALIDAPPSDAVLVDGRHDLAQVRSLTRVIRTTGIECPLLLVLTEGGLAVAAADWGMDDVILTTSGPAELEARLRLAIGRRAAALEGDDGESHLISSSGLVVDDATYTAKLENRTLDLTFKEFELVKFLAQHPGRVFTRQQLLQEVWGYDYFGGTRTVDVHVRRLRAKLGADHETLIGTVRNVGYRFVAATGRRLRRRPAPTSRPRPKPRAADEPTLCPRAARRRPRPGLVHVVGRAHRHRLHPADYQASLRAAAERAGTDESVITGRGTVRGRPVAVVANEFGFLAGSIGLAAARRIVSAVRRATSEGIPVLASTASGGTRMQEGTQAFVQMIEISRAIMDHRAAGLPYLVHLRHPTTGGVFASWGSLGHITVAEPGALIGFLGPKVFELLENRPFPPGIQVSENLANRGIIDAVVLAEELPTVVDRALGLLIDPPSESTRERRTGEVTRRRTAWESIEITRAAERPGVREVLRYGSDATVRLRAPTRASATPR